MSAQKVGVLAIETGDYTAYVAYFDDPVRLQAAVDQLNAERMDSNTGELANAEVRVEKIQVVPDAIDDDFLDLLAALLNDSVFAEIEDAKDRRERLAEEAAEEAEPEPFIPSPGQMELPQ